MPASTIPDFKIRVNGADLPPAALGDIQSVTVQEDLGALSMFALVLYNWDQERLQISWSDSSLFAVGNDVELWLGYIDQLDKVMMAEITSLEPAFTADQPPLLTVRGYDHRHRLQRGRKTRTFAKMKDSAIVQQVAGAAGLVARVKDTKTTLEYVVQSNQTDWEFLQSRAARIGYEVYVKDKTLYFQPPQHPTPPQRKLLLNGDISEFTPRLSSLAQVGEVTVRGWDVKQKKVIAGKAGVGQEATVMGGKSSGPRRANRAFGKTTVASVDQPVRSAAEADQIALGRFNEMALTYIQGNAIANGDAKLHAGTVVEIEGAGQTFSGAYYITSVTHSITPEQGFQTSFAVQRNAT